jgi:hypothetical protein
MLPIHLNVRLLTRDGALVVDGSLPPYNFWPEVIFWEQRVFCFFGPVTPEGGGEPVGHYREARAVPLTLVEAREIGVAAGPPKDKTGN